MNARLVVYKAKWWSLFMLLCIVGVALAGCASDPAVQNAGSILTTEFDKDGKPLKTTEQRTDYATYLKSFEGASVNAKLVEMDCGATECSFKGKLTIYAPATGNRPVPQAPAVHESDGWKVWREIKETAIGVAGVWVPWHYGSKVLTRAFDASSQPVTTNTTTNVTASGPGASAAAGGSATGSYSAPTTTTTTTTTNSNNTTRTCNGGAGATGGSGGSGSTTGGAGAAGGAGGPATC